MSLRSIEGTWEEIKRHKAEFIGRQLRVIIKPESSEPPKASMGTCPPRVSAMGKYAGVLSSEDFMRQKQEEIDLEERAQE